MLIGNISAIFINLSIQRYSYLEFFDIQLIDIVLTYVANNSRYVLVHPKLAFEKGCFFEKELNLDTHYFVKMDLLCQWLK
jgi:hypothetical protein